MATNEPTPRPPGAERSALSRRTFLAMSAGAALLTACQPRSLVQVPAPTTGADLRVGLLVPRYSVHPQLGVELQQGLDQGLNAAGLDAAITATAVGHGLGAAAEGFDAAVAAGADVVVGVLSSLVAPELAGAAAANSVPLLVASAGANVIDPGDASPWVAYSSLNLWQSNAMLGDWAARTVGRRVWMASSAFDAGYDSAFAFEAAFVAAGGAVVGRSVTHVPGAADDGLASLAGSAAGSGADLVFGQYSGDRATDFVRATTGVGRPVLGSAFTAEGATTDLGSGADGLVTAVGWPSDTSSPFVALGLETAAALAAVGSPRSGLRLVAFDSARGRCEVDTATNSVLGPVQRAVVRGGRIVPEAPLGTAAPSAAGHRGISGLLEEYLLG